MVESWQSTKEQIEGFLDEKVVETEKAMVNAKELTIELNIDTFELSIKKIIDDAYKEVEAYVTDNFPEPKSFLGKLWHNPHNLPVIEVFEEKLRELWEKKYGQRFETIKNYTNYMARNVIEEKGFEGEDDVL